MKYKLLKQFDKCSIPVWDTFDMWDKEYCSLDFDDSKISIAWLIKEWYIEKIEEKIWEPKFHIWDKVIYEGKDVIFFSEIKHIRFCEWKYMYHIVEWFYLEENLKLASKEAWDKKSKFYWVYPF